MAAAVLAWVLLVFTAGAATAARADRESVAALTLPDLFANSMVFQAGKPIRLWGTAMAGTVVHVSLDAQKATVRAAADGRWELELAPMAPGGPYTLTIQSGGSAKVIDDVLVGEVWLCSGQSNMAFAVRESLDAAPAIATSADAGLRLFHVDQQSAVSPAARFQRPARWQSAGPETVPSFSAACYFMGRRLREQLQVPVGLIAAAWGGTGIDAWRDDAALAATGDAASDLGLLQLYRREPDAALARFGEQWQAAWRKAAGDSDANAPWAAGAHRLEQLPAFTDWNLWPDRRTRGFLGIVWYRATIRLDADAAARIRSIEIGRADDIDLTFVNGRIVGSTAEGNASRRYPVPKGLLRAGENVIAIAVHNLAATGGLLANPAPMLIGEGAQIAIRDWQVRIEPKFERPPMPRAPWEARAGLGGPYFGMIAPLGRFSMRGVAWYQGEAEARPGRPDRYAERLGALVTSWRGQFGDPALPFMIVQLPEYRARTAAPSESLWAQLRDQQRIAAGRLGHAHLVTASGLGSEESVHPVSKAPLGDRLARVAGGLAGGPFRRASGPVPLAAIRSGATIRLRFEAEGRLVAFGGPALPGFELCDAAERCRGVPARLEGEQVLLDGATGDDRWLRYAWADFPVLSLSDDSQVMTSSFRLPISRQP